MECVNGIGGFFFRSRDRAGLRRWYEEALGLPPPPKSYDESPWVQREGQTVFEPFDLDSEMIGAPEHTWMLNFRVDDLEAMIAQLRAGGAEVEVDPVEYPNGWFAQTEDPEGNRIQLWQPK